MLLRFPGRNNHETPRDLLLCAVAKRFDYEQALHIQCFTSRIPITHGGNDSIFGYFLYSSQHSQVAALQAPEIEAPLLAAFAGSAQALGEGRVWLQERLAGRGHVAQALLLHG